MNLSIVDEMNVTREYPSFFYEEEGSSVVRPVTLDEINKVLERFEKGKSPGLDGWTMEFFLEFFDILGEELFDVVE